MSSNAPTQAPENIQDCKMSPKEPLYKPRESLPALECPKPPDKNYQEDHNSKCLVPVSKDKERKSERILDPIPCD